MGISDHSAGWTENFKTITFFDESLSFSQYVDDLRETQKKFPFLRAGLECDINQDGSLNIPKHLKGLEMDRFGLDYLIGSVHPDKFMGDRKQLVELLEYVIVEYPIDIIGHIFQPLLSNELGFFNTKERDRIISAIQRTGRNVFIEVNGNPSPSDVSNKYLKTYGRYDLQFLKQCTSNGIRFVIGSDAHKVEEIGRYPRYLVEELQNYPGAFIHTIPLRKK